MLELIAFMLSMLIFPFVAASVAKLLYVVTQRGEIFGGWQNVLNSIHPKGGEKGKLIRMFWYNRLGGCITCMRQFVSELVFIHYLVLWQIYGDFPTAYIDNVVGRWVVNLTIFIAFCGVALTLGQRLEYEKAEAKAAEAEEEILITKSRKL